MSRHRNVRSMNYEEYIDDDDDYCSPSFEDKYCISPGTVAQFTFNRDGKNVHLASYMGDDIPEENEVEETPNFSDSSNTISKKLSDIDQAKLNSCLEEIRNILGDTSTEQVLTECILKHNFNTETALNELLAQSDAPKPQRPPRENRRNKSEGDDEKCILSNIVCQSNLTSSLDHFEFKSQNRNVPISLSQGTGSYNKLSSLASTPPQKSIHSLSLVLSQMSKKNNSDSKLIPIANSKTPEQNEIVSHGSGINLQRNIVSVDGGNTSVQIGKGDSHNTSEKTSLSPLFMQNKMKIPNLQCTGGETRLLSKHGGGLTLSNLAVRHQSSKLKPALSKNTGGLSLADLANEHRKGTSDVSSIKTHKLSLDALALNHQLSNISKPANSSIATQQDYSRTDINKPPVDKNSQKKSSGISLAALAKTGQPQSSKEGIESNQHIGISTDASKSADISLASLTINKTSKSKKTDTDSDLTNQIDVELSDNYLERCDSPSINLFIENNHPLCPIDKHIIKYSSGIGRILAMIYHLNASPHKQMSSCSRLFSYSHQVRDQVKKTSPKKHHITPYDFSLPSPDDIIKERQKAAFK